MTLREKKNDYLVQGSVLAIAGIITRLIGMLYRLPLTRIVGSEGMGYYNTAYELYNLALLISTYSIPVALSKLIAEKDSRKEYKNSYRLFQIAFIISSVIGALCSILLFVFADELSALIKWPSVAIPLKFLAPTIFVFSLMGIIRGLFQGKRTMVPTALSQVFEQLFNAAASIVAAILLINAYKDTEKAAAYGAAGGTLGTFIGAVAGLVFLVFIFRINKGYFKKKKFNDLTDNKDDDITLAKAILLTMLPIILSQTIYQVSGIIDNVMFAGIMDKKGLEEGERSILWEAYSNKYKWLYNVPVAIASAFGVSIVPILSKAYAERRTMVIKQKIFASIKLNMIIAIPAAVGLCVLAKPILLLMFNDTNDQLSPDLMMLGSIAVVFFALSTLTNGILQGINHMRTPVIHAAISLAVHIFIVILCVSVFDLGAYGMVIGNVSYGLMVCILNWISLDKLLNYKQEIKTTFVIPFASSAIMGIVSWLLYKGLYMIFPSNAFAVIPSLFIAVFTYFVVLILFKGINKEEILNMPKGTLLLRLAVKMRLIKE